MTETWRAISCPDISEEALKRVFDAAKLPWEGALHVTATNALSITMRSRNLRAVSVRDLMNIVLWAGMPDLLRVPISTYPDLGAADFAASREGWAAHQGRGARELGTEADECIRKTLGEVLLNFETAARPPTEAEQAALLLKRGVRDLRRAIQILAAAGFRPGDIAVSGSDPELQVAVACWEKLQADVPQLFRIREDLWMDRAEVAEATSEQARGLRARIDEALAHLSGMPEGVRYIVYHGFYFFTPPQWAWFQLLRALPETAQVFVVHDDGSSPVSEIWRRYFASRLEMPLAQGFSHWVEAPAAGHRGGGVLQEALAGLPVSSSSPSLHLIGFDNAAEFVEARIQEGEGAPRLYAADEKSLKRVLTRFSTANRTTTDLANIPFGQFLLGFHDSISFTPQGKPVLEPSAEPFLRMAASGFLDTRRHRPSTRLAAFRRAMPYFAGASTIEEWKDRAETLRRVVESVVDSHGYRDEPDAVDDVQRMADAADNLLRLVPWCDLSDADAAALCSGIQAIADLFGALTASDEGTVAGYLRDIKTKVNAYSLLDDEARNELDTRLEAAGLPNGSVSIEGIVDAVSYILRREAGEVLADSLDGDQDEDEEDADPSTSPGTGFDSVSPLRSLDALVFKPATDAIHIANLSETKFPALVTSVPWPFVPHRLRVERDERLGISKAILRQRDESAGLGDLYLLSLALSGVAPGVTLTLSWMREEGNERPNRSPLLALISRQGAATARGEGDSALDAEIGGVVPDHQSVEVSSHQAVMAPEEAEDERRPSEAGLSEAVHRVHHLAAASAFACARRFILQWALGPSGAFQAEHHQQWLYGNLIGGLFQRKLVRSESEAKGIADDLWPHLTEAQRKSSLNDRVIIPGPSASWKWLYTLRGKKQAFPRDPVSEAYNAARRGWRPSSGVMAPDDEVLPSAPARPANRWEQVPCGVCPVRSRCAVAIDDD